MPSLFRFLTILAVIGAIGWAILYALAVGVSPTPREMFVPVPIPEQAG